MPALSSDPRQLPEPDADALAHSQALTGRILAAIDRDGPMPFSRFMDYALYEPGYGYYMNPLRKFGAEGDFITAPESAPLFSRCLARYCENVLKTLPGGAILEPGAGSGAMAAEILNTLYRRECLPARYFILELSGPLRARQEETLRRLPDEVFQRVEWLDSLDDFEMTGIVLANEVVDAIPVERFEIDAGDIRMVAVDRDPASGSLCFRSVEADEALRDAVESIQSELGISFADGYCSEVNRRLPAWLTGMAGCLSRGVMLTIDYGYPRSEFYLPERGMGTLMCHYRHRAHADPLLWPGLQDMTAHVDFTALAEAAAQAGLDVAGYTHQAGFLLDSGIEELLGGLMQGDAAEQLHWSQQAKTLLLPGEMGERFKVMALTKQYNDLPVFGDDQRHRL